MSFCAAVVKCVNEIGVEVTQQYEMIVSTKGAEVTQQVCVTKTNQRG